MFTRTKNKTAPRISQSRQYLFALQKSFRSRLEAFRQNRTSDAQNTLVNDFNQVLIAWGIESEADIPVIIRQLRLRCLIFAMTMFISLCIVSFLQNFLAYLSLVCVLLPCLFGVTTTLWRISILKHHRFISLPHWLFALPFSR